MQPLPFALSAGSIQAVSPNATNFKDVWQYLNFLQFYPLQDPLLVADVAFLHFPLQIELANLPAMPHSATTETLKGAVE